MITSIDISYYPLQEEYIPPILDFIERLRKHKNIRVQSNGMSTQVFGEFRLVMEILRDEIETSFVVPQSVFVLKIINSDLQFYSNH
ncbi:MAG TPA: hypothetical protein DCG69_09145 [Bacteroidales bacterium]|nr:hypothetical protein [Bacteroidales bacterium]